MDANVIAKYSRHGFGAEPYFAGGCAHELVEAQARLTPRVDLDYLATASIVLPKALGLAKARLKCAVTWFRGPADYFGTVTPFYAIRHNVVLAGVHYVVHAVDDRCYFHSGHRAACPVETKRK